MSSTSRRRSAISTFIQCERCCVFLPSAPSCALRAEPWVPSERFAEDDDAVPGGQHQARVALFASFISLPGILLHMVAVTRDLKAPILCTSSCLNRQSYDRHRDLRAVVAFVIFT